MGRSWLDTRDAFLLPFSQNISTKLSATPAAYGAVAGDATALATLVSDFDTKLTTAQNPATRTKVSVTAKDVSKAALIAELRALYKKFNAANIPADKRQELGLPILDKTPTPVAPPTTKPVLTIRDSDKQGCSVRAKDELTLETKAKPPGVEGLEILMTIQPAGTPAPADLRQWFSGGIAKRSDFVIPFEPSDAGKVAHIRAAWFSTRGSRGPLSDIVSLPIAA